jgi:TnpA family transposase
MFSEREITRYYSLSAEELVVIEQHRRPQNRLGFTVQLAYLRFPGRPWDPREQVPPAILLILLFSRFSDKSELCQSDFSFQHKRTTPIWTAAVACLRHN